MCCLYLKIGEPFFLLDRYCPSKSYSLLVSIICFGRVVSGVRTLTLLIL
jgi:hypothetical protein